MVHEVAIVRCRVGRQQTTRVVLLLSTINRLWKGRRSGRIHAGIGCVEILLVVKLKVQTQPIVVVVIARIHDENTLWLLETFAATIVDGPGTSIVQTVRQRRKGENKLSFVGSRAGAGVFQIENKRCLGVTPSCPKEVKVRTTSSASPLNKRGVYYAAICRCEVVNISTSMGRGVSV